MKKLFQIIGLITLMGISFFYTEKIVMVVKDYDDIMIEIKKEASNYKKEPVNALKIGNKIRPGISGEQININKSYNKMKKYGKFDQSLLVYETINPKISVNKKDKFIIGGNTNIKKVSLVFLLNDGDNLDSIIKILNNKNIKASFFLDDDYLHNNTSKVNFLIKNKHTVGMINISNWNNSIIKKIYKQNNNYCYTSKENLKVLKRCKKNDNYTILIDKSINRNYYHTIKQILSPGEFFLLKINNQLIYELPPIINYINSRGYDIVSLEEIIQE